MPDKKSFCTLTIYISIKSEWAVLGRLISTLTICQFTIINSLPGQGSHACLRRSPRLMSKQCTLKLHARMQGGNSPTALMMTLCLANRLTYKIRIKVVLISEVGGLCLYNMLIS